MTRFTLYPKQCVVSRNLDRRVISTDRFPREWCGYGTLKRRSAATISIYKSLANVACSLCRWPVRSTTHEFGSDKNNGIVGDWNRGDRGDRVVGCRNSRAGLTASPLKPLGPLIPLISLIALVPLISLVACSRWSLESLVALRTLETLVALRSLESLWAL